MAVSPTDVMDAMRCGLRVYGSSSMGALRAVELEPFGMIGHGVIFEHIRETPYFRDDFLGQTFSESTVGPQSEPYINFFFALQNALAKNQVGQHDYVTLEKTYRELHFAERDLANLKVTLREQHLEDSARLYSLATKALENHNQKHIDGIGLIKKIKADLEQTEILNDKLASLAGTVPQYEGLIPTQEEFEEERKLMKGAYMDVRKSAMREMLLNVAAHRRSKDNS